MLSLPPMEYPDVNTLPKPILGYRLCKLIQYDDVDAWTFTSSFGKNLKFRGASLSFTTWVPGQAQAKAKSTFHVSGWLNESGGWTDELLLQLIEDGVGFIYIHESGEKNPLTIQEYQEFLGTLDASVQTTAQPTLQV